MVFLGEKEDALNEEEGLDDEPQYEKFTQNQRWSILALVSFAAFINPLCLTFFFPAQNVVQDFYGSSPLLAIVCIQMFPVFSGVFPFMMSPISDRLGRKTVLFICLPVFLASQFLSPFSPSIGWLIFGRALAGAGIAPALAVGTGCIYDAFPPEKRAFALGLLLAPSTIGSLIGPTLGGLVTQSIGWKWSVWVPGFMGVPIVAAVFVFLPETLDKRPHMLVGQKLPSWNPLTPIWTYLFSQPIFWFTSARALSMSAVLTTIPMSNYVLASYPNNFSPLLLGVSTVPFSLGAIFGSVVGGKFPDFFIHKVNHPFGGMIPGIISDCLLSIMLIVWSNMIYVSPWVAIGLTSLIGIFSFASRTSYFSTIISIKPNRASTLSALVQLWTFLAVGVWSFLAPLILDYTQTIVVVFSSLAILIDLLLVPVTFITIKSIFTSLPSNSLATSGSINFSSSPALSPSLASFPSTIPVNLSRDVVPTAFSPSESHPLLLQGS